MKAKLQTISTIAILFIALRCIFEGLEQQDYLVAVINIFALLAVVYLITEQIVQGIVDAIKSMKVPAQIENREIRDIKLHISLWIYIPFALLSVAYFFFLSSGLGNDIISIIALGLSMCNDHIVSIAISSYRKKEK